MYAMGWHVGLSPTRKTCETGGSCPANGSNEACNQPITILL